MKFAAIACVITLGTLLVAAEYQGQDIDGQMFDASVYSYAAGNWYSLSVSFDGSTATVYFPRGGHLDLELDDETIEDPGSISAYDSERGNWWEIDLKGLD